MYTYIMPYCIPYLFLADEIMTSERMQVREILTFRSRLVLYLRTSLISQKLHSLPISVSFLFKILSARPNVNCRQFAECPVPLNFYHANNAD
jgi:hypothetical protein